MQRLNAWQTCLTCMRVANMANLTTIFLHSCRLLFSTFAAVHSGVLWPLAASIWVGSSCVLAVCVSSFCCYQPLMFCQLFINCLSNCLSTVSQLFINFHQHFTNMLSTFINFLSTLSTFYQLFINVLSIFYQLFISFLSTVYQLFINFFYQLGRNDHFWQVWDIVCIAARSYYVLGGPESQHTLSWCPGVSSHALLDEMLLVN